MYCKTFSVNRYLQVETSVEIAHYVRKKQFSGHLQCRKYKQYMLLKKPIAEKIDSQPRNLSVLKKMYSKTSKHCFQVPAMISGLQGDRPGICLHVTLSAASIAVFSCHVSRWNTLYWSVYQNRESQCIMYSIQ